MKSKFTLSALMVIAGLMIANAQIVDIPNANFKACLVAISNLNTNGDNEIQVTEANTFTGTINCSNKTISNVAGIEEFTEITKLTLFGNSLDSLDLSNNLELEQVLLEQNSLEGLVDVSMLSKLVDFKIHTNPDLEVINVANGNNTNFTRFQAQECTSLSCVKVDDTVFSISSALWLIDLPSLYDESCGIISNTNKTFLSENITFFPNPAHNVVHISSDVPYKIVSIHSIMGGELPVRQTTQRDLDVSTFSNGIYLVRVETANGFSIFNLLKQ